MRLMAWDADLIQLMKQQGQDNSLRGIALATMTGPKSCKLKDGLELGAGELRFAEHLVNPLAVKVAGHCPADGELQDKTQYISALKAGDEVAVYQLSDSKVLILEKMVSV